MSILDEYNKILKKYFGYDKLKDKQFQIIDALLNKQQDVLGVLPTGFGKSMCYMLPYLITKKNVIVVSPLIALMKDQQTELINKKIPVCVLNSDNNNKIQDKSDILINKKNKIIYITPEYLLNCETFIKKLAESDSIAFIAIDEAHCASSWGNDFRPTYSKIGIIREWITNVPMLALTATASIKVREDISGILGLTKHLTILESFDRPNLRIIVKKKIDHIHDLKDILMGNTEDYTIIYCKTRDETDTLASKITKMGIHACPYHAGLEADEKNDIQASFIKGEFKCIVATIAFGLGVNIPNVRVVIHYGCPQNIESYYQEIGRAGRDGLPSICYMYYSAKDFMMNRRFLENIADVKYKKYQEYQVMAMERFAYSSNCRRRMLLGHFSENYTVANCANCDNCLSVKVVINKEYTKDALKVMGLIGSLNWNYGSATIADALIGSKAKKMAYLMKSPFYGSGGDEKKDYWLQITRELLNTGYLMNKTIKGAFGATVLHLTVNGVKWLTEVKNVNNTLKNKLDDSFKLYFNQNSHAEQPEYEFIEVVEVVKVVDNNKVTPDSTTINKNNNQKQYDNSQNDFEIIDDEEEEIEAASLKNNKTIKELESKIIKKSAKRIDKSVKTVDNKEKVITIGANMKKSGSIDLCYDLFD